MPRPIGVVARHDRVDRRAQRVAARAGLDAEERPQRLGDRREGRSAGRVAARAEHRRALRDAAAELVDEPRLAEAGRPEQHDESRAGRGDGRVVHRSESAQLVVPAHERGRVRARGAVERGDAVGGHGAGAAAQRERAERRERHERSDEPLGRLADEHVAVVRLLLEPRGDVGRVADHARLVVRHHDLAGVHRHAQADALRRGDLLARELAEGALHADRRADGAQRVVLRDARDAERGEHAIAEQLHDRPAVELHGGRHRAVVAIHEAARGLGLESFVERDRADQVGEDDRHDLARDRLVGGAVGERRSAGVTELRTRLARAAARGAARGERRAAAAAEPCARAIRAAAARALHGDHRR